ncbi:hypothetical protein Agub_g12940 [Astrephomene gubernaculifera]|uniref:HIT domain-containing protein n=1 Tax=Astrephomene gubernaculifera TaxID=47775 RepID=A0AAD3HRQ4_9CHLO|nr:hypothetical protein Agub_g12940 [Astrephomene gubernaculifera]
MAKLLFPTGKFLNVARGTLRPLGRADVARYAEAVTVSRVQCVVSATTDKGHPALKLTSQGSQNPTLVLSKQEPHNELSQGQSALLGDGEAFSLICTRPDLAIRVEMDPADLQPESRPEPDALAHPITPTAATTSPSKAAAPAEAPSSGDIQDEDKLPSSPYASDDGGASPGRPTRPRHLPTAAAASAPAAGTAAGTNSAASSPGEEAPAAAGDTPGPSRGGQGRRSSGGGGGGGGAGSARGVGNDKPPAATRPPVVLLLAGLPGSGKSTFSRLLMEASPIAWVHINQDAIRSGGRPGSREQCITAAKAALAQGACCIIDRCHGDAQQRSSFLALAAERGVAAHCVALQQPPELCARRVADRTDHPGGVQGNGGKRVVYQMAKQQQVGNSWPPACSEGFVSIMDCNNDADAAAAVAAWALYGREEPAASSAAATTAAEAAAGAAHGSAQVTHGSARAPSGSKKQRYLAEAARTLAAWEAHAGKRKRPSAGITAFFKPAAAAAGSGRSAAAAAAAGAGTAAPAASAAPAAKAAAGRAGAGAAGTTAAAKLVGKRPASPVPLAAAGSPKRRAVGVQPGGAEDAGGAVVEQKKKQSCDKPQEGTAGAREAGTSSPASQPGGDSGAGASGRNAFSVLMASATRNARDGGPAGAGAANASSSKHPSDLDTASDKRFKLTAPWAQHLRKVALSPEDSGQKIFHKDDQVILIADAYPKARHHALVIARDPSLRSITDLRARHVPLLSHMRRVAEEWVRDQRKQDPETAAFKLGFHAVPSMCQLHMHVVSQDFDSPSLKNKKHWNSFTTPFFIPFDNLERELVAQGRHTPISPDEEKELETQELRCHGCSKVQKSLPELKQHIVACGAVKGLVGL